MSRAKTETPSKSTAARDHILATAGQLFYQKGYHAVGVDTIVAESGVAKMTLYRHFPSKDDLIVAYLQQANDEFWAWWDEAIAPFDGDARQQLIGLFEAAAVLSTLPICYGCAFQMTAGEFPDPAYPGHRIALDHKRAVIQRLIMMSEAAGVAHPTDLGHHLYFLMEGVWASRRMFGTESLAHYAPSAVRTLLAE